MSTVPGERCVCVLEDKHEGKTGEKLLPLGTVISSQVDNVLDTSLMDESNLGQYTTARAFLTARERD